MLGVNSTVSCEMKKQFVTIGSWVLLGPIAMFGCSQPQTSEPEVSEAPTAETAEAEPVSGEVGTMEFRANGEDFVRKGFVSKDGWQIDFENIYVNFADAQAYETLVPYDADAGGEPQAKQVISLVESKTVDLAAGDENAETILVNEVPAPPGRYSALSWKMVPAAEGPAAGYPLLIKGTASKDGQTVPFTLKFNEELAFTCGDYVGDDRKGILQPGDRAEMEATFHFDHLFGDGEAAPEDEINTGALGFEPIAAMATDGSVDTDLDTLNAQLSAEDSQKLMEILPNLAHVGEGHCTETQMSGE